MKYHIACSLFLIASSLSYSADNQPTQPIPDKTKTTLTPVTMQLRYRGTYFNRSSQRTEPFWMYKMEFPDKTSPRFIYYRENENGLLTIIKPQPTAKDFVDTISVPHAQSIQSTVIYIKK